MTDETHPERDANAAASQGDDGYPARHASGFLAHWCRGCRTRGRNPFRTRCATSRSKRSREGSSWQEAAVTGLMIGSNARPRPT